jgi:hypothetical protein
MSDAQAPFDSADDAAFEAEDVMLILRRPGELAEPGAHATLRLAEALLRVKREQPEAWKILWAAGVRLNEKNIELLTQRRDHPSLGVDP